MALTALTLAELLCGLDLLPDGRRKTDLSGRLDAVLRRGFGGRVLPFDHAAAQAYARLKGDRDRAGRPLVGYDVMIAAIAQTHGAGIVTRNVDALRDAASRSSTRGRTDHLTKSPCCALSDFAATAAYQPLRAGKLADDS